MLGGYTWTVFRKHIHEFTLLECKCVYGYDRYWNSYTDFILTCRKDVLVSWLWWTYCLIMMGLNNKFQTACYLICAVTHEFFLALPEFQYHRSRQWQKNHSSLLDGNMMITFLRGYPLMYVYMVYIFRLTSCTLPYPWPICIIMFPRAGL